MGCEGAPNNIFVPDCTAKRLILSPNDPDQWLAAEGLSTPLGFIASPLHRLVRLRSLEIGSKKPNLGRADLSQCKCTRRVQLLEGFQIGLPHGLVSWKR